MIEKSKSKVKNRWDIRCQDYDTVKMLERLIRERFSQISFSDRKVNILAKLLYNRNIYNEGDMDKFFDLSLSRIPDPLLLPDMEVALKRIREAIKKKEKITVYGDYDVDGITSVTILYKYLKSCGCPVDYYIPDRNEEGYGLNCKALDKIKASGTQLLITVDTGTTAADELVYANELQLDVVVTDHHECKQRQIGNQHPCDIIPSAIAVINPKRMSSRFPFSDLAGVGVVFLLIAALMGNIEKAFALYGIYTMIGTIADIMPLVQENRIIVTNGLRLMSEFCPVGVKALLMESDSNKSVSASLVAFQIAPRLNAAGRIGDPSRSVELLLCEDMRSARVIAKELCESNRTRQQMELDILNEAESLMAEQYVSDNIIVLHSDNWHHGVIGIVASRLTEKYKKPCIMLCREGEHYKGSGRSVSGVNIFELLNNVSDVLLKFGGHEMAAGLTVEKDNLRAFSEKLAAEANKLITPEMLIPIVQAECEIEYSDLDIELLDALKLLEPFGTMNPSPLFLVRNILVTDVDSVGNGKHTRVHMLEPETLLNPLSAIAFNSTNEDLNCIKNDKIDVMCMVSENLFNGKVSLSVQIKDVNLNAETEEKVLFYKNKYHKFIETGAITSDIMLKRDDISAVYRYLKQIELHPHRTLDISYGARRISFLSGRDINYARFRLCVDVLTELGLLESEFTDVLTYRIINKTQKSNLMLSPMWRSVSNVL